MDLNELQREAERLSPKDQHKLIAFLVVLGLRRDANYRNELTRRLDDKSSDSWMKLQEAERWLERDEV